MQLQKCDFTSQIASESISNIAISNDLKYCLKSMPSNPLDNAL